MIINTNPTLRKFINCPDQKKKNFDLINIKKKKEKRNKSGLLPQLFANLTETEKQEVKASMVAYNNIYGDQPYYEPEQYYQQIYKKSKLIKGAANV